MSIRTQLTLSLCFFILFSIIGVGLNVIVLTNKSLNDLAYTTLESQANVQLARIEAIISKHWERLQGVASRTQMRISLERHLNSPNEKDYKKIHKIIGDAKSSILDYQDIFILNAKGQVVISTSKKFEGRNDVTKRYFQNAQSARSLYYKNSGNAENGQLYLSGPLYLNDKYLGVIVIVQNLTSFKSAAQNAGDFGQTGEVLLIQEKQAQNEDSPFILQPRLLDTALKRQSSSSTLRALLKSTTENKSNFFSTIDYRDQDVLVTSRYLPEMRWWIFVKQDKSEIFELLHDMRFNLMGSTVSVLVIALLLSFWAARKISQPLVKLKKHINSLLDGDMPPEVKKENEINSLSRSFEFMLKRLKEQRSILEEEVRHQTTSLQEKIEDLERLNKASVDREMRIIELKKEINIMAEKLGEKKPFDPDSTT